ncbi:hypothetical protein [uncultured Neptuniibacter sp.]|uniref:hypothetical protein n=1 Tax=uncultured Neptuniibacter sp. TaxID=502143 RepID=UPI00260E1701|nr:hypothetical protein [uncultured Neptuniibacter sp.]
MQEGAFQGDRRKGGDRRKLKDRREDIRFEPGKTDRRKTRGRRAEDGDPWDKYEGE